LRIPTALLALILASCGQHEATVIDGSSPEAFERTTTAARRDLPVADRLTFDRALHTLAGRHFGNDDPQARARVTFDGMTAEQVVKDQRARDAR
jgi:hypothetical protein